jgi:NitT/TauT family transport system permease protein
MSAARSPHGAQRNAGPPFPDFIRATLPALLGVGTLVVFLVAVEVLIRIGVINRYIVPLPTQIAAAFERVALDEDIAGRDRLTFIEAFVAGAMITIIGVLIGMLLYRFPLWRRATETWIAALASAPTVLMYPLFLVIFGRSAWTIIMMGFVAGLPPVVLKTIEGLATTRTVLVNVGRSLKLTGLQLFTKILFPAALPTIFTGVRLGLIFTTARRERRLRRSVQTSAPPGRRQPTPARWATLGAGP